MNNKNPTKNVLPSYPCHPPALTSARIQTNTTISANPIEIEPLTHDEQEMLRHYRAAYSSNIAR